MNRPHHQSPAFSHSQRGGFGLGFLVGLLVGVGLALAVALYVTKAPVPFVDKVPALPKLDEKAEAERNKDWDPNAGLASKAPRPATAPTEAPAEGDGSAVPPPGTPPSAVATPSAGSSTATAVSTPAAASSPAAPSPTLTETAPKPAALISKDSGSTAAGKALSGKVSSAGDPYVYYVQAGAFQRPDEAETQRAKLALLGVEARVIDREQGGKMMHRVRMGPFDKSKDAEALRDKLNAAGLEAAMVRVERSPP